MERHQRALHDAGRRLAESQKLVEPLIQLVQRRKTDLQHEAILTCDPVTFRDFRQFLRQFRDPRQRTRARPDAHEGAYPVAQDSGGSTQLRQCPFVLGGSCSA